ncbi:lysozyme inhibitor LprI family protein [Microvirga rosea]|uniref:lysozyme inhibitor LprI family protein n=1 Tax=Microvirga rosea TaxID=2715425 RepID=UPI001D0A6C38|nr:lysozyme inhibitor LprI family protein [Microvirga rosea]MCB8819552.1 lysozyme inhibitor LprI family protein [Microvirga rosea]
MVRPSHVEQIVDWKERRGRSRLGFELIYHLESLKHHWEKASSTVEQFSDFVPMRIATILEVFSRETVRDIIDTGSPYLDRAESLFKNVKIDFWFATNLHGRRLSLGDIIAHSISVNDITQVTSVLEKLLPGYREALPKVCDRLSVEVKGSQPVPIIDDTDLMFTTLGRLFEVRHILTHEIPRTAAYETTEINGFLKAAEAFLKATDWYVSQQLRGEVPLTQTEMNIHAGDALQAELENLKEKYSKVEALPDINKQLLADCQSKWELFSDSEANLHAALVEGGSMYPLVWASAKQELVRQRSDQLQWWLEREEGDL